MLPAKLQPFCLGLNVLRPEKTSILSWSLSRIFHANIKSPDHTDSSSDTQQINGLVQDCSNSSALAMELLQACTKPSKW